MGCEGILVTTSRRRTPTIGQSGCGRHDESKSGQTRASTIRISIVIYSSLCLSTGEKSKDPRDQDGNVIYDTEADFAGKTWTAMENSWTAAGAGPLDPLTSA